MRSGRRVRVRDDGGKDGTMELVKDLFLTEEESAALHDALNAGASAVRTVLARAWARQGPEAGTTSFGCGT